MLLQEVILLALVYFEVTTSIPLKDEKIKTVDLNSLCIKTGGKGKETNKSPVLLVHGLGVNLGNWDGVQQVIALRTGRRVCAVDLRNHGGSPWNNDSDVAIMAADIGRFLDKEKIKKVNIIGHSLGGKIAVHFTLTNPERVDSLIVEDMRANGITDAALNLIKMAVKLLRAAIKFVPDGSTEDQARTIIAQVIFRKLAEMNMTYDIEDVTSRIIPINCTGEKCRYEFNMDLLEKVIDQPLPESTGLYEEPALFIYGTRSIFEVNSDRRNIRKLFPNAKFVGISGAGHTIHEQFREFDDEVIKFLNN